MSERASFRGARGGSHRGGGGGRGQGSHANNARGGAQGGGGEKPKKENILDLTKYMDKEISVKFNGGREGMSLLHTIARSNRGEMGSGSGGSMGVELDLSKEWGRMRHNANSMQYQLPASSKASTSS